MMRRPFQRISWQAFISAIQFLTIIPCGQRPIFNARAALPYFPLCGLLIGAILVGIHTLSGLLWPDPIVALLDVVSLVVLTGGLHLDGLADTADGLYGHRSLEQALAIMKDSRIGAMGTISVVCCLAIKWAGMAHLIGPADKPLWLLLVPAYARSAVLFGIKSLPYGRPGGGTAHAFFQAPLSIKDFWGVGLLAGISLFSGRVLFGLNLGFAAVVFIIIGWYRKKMQCITGDMLGAMIEVTEATLFLIAAAQWSG
jgi:adenosylcobinamide-GDP ribazoletransferase